ncbi:nuclear transport factor 2 family protein [Novosphingobium aerophilum]|uniref:Nuclear transport factor 2 family protein n=1 Tax=Novosphingobium aerophilum TaxID=2839843 RepID=A0A7X1F4W0_9SPHN|nr:nuclear transport factor 2 family protein [Novosphingobium aerophilum]MBC2650442.1 nuclear transport factor 2 family protein [Novosphingobium aerophilum]
MSDRLAWLADRQEILDCLTRFCRGMDRFDRDLFLSAFHPHAEIAAGPFVGSPADCWDWAVPMHEAAQPMTQHLLLNHSVEIVGDEAHSETYYQFIARNHPFTADGGETVMQAGGRYIDRLERGADGWRIALRINLIEWNCLQPSLPLPFGEIADAALNGIAARDRSDPGYARPLVNRRPHQRP